MKETPGFSLSDWLRGNIFACINLLVLIAGFAYQQGQLNTKVGGMEARVVINEKKISEMELFGHPDHERRIVLLESRNDQLTKLAGLQEQQSKNIADLTTIVAKDHDVLIRFATLAEQKNAPK